MPKQKLFDEDSEDEVGLKTENEYAKKYDKWREKEELHKLEQKYGSKALNSDASISSDSEDESDEPPEVSEEIETQFLKTLALLKTKDPRIYDPEFKFFDESEKKEQEKEAKTKKLTFADSDDDDDNDENDGNIFSIEKKAEVVHPDTKLSSQKEGKIKDFLTGKADHIGNEVEKDLAPLKALWSDPKLNEGEAFLRDYILDKRYLDDGDLGEAEDKMRDDEDLEADEERVEEQGKFERAYNFRFEEPDQEYLKRFPRTMNYIRPKDDRRSRKRTELRERKEEEKRRKMEEISRLKALKLKEIQEKMEKIKEVTGNEDLPFKEDDLNSDFDPEEHDRRMKEIFDEEYYGEADADKPVFPELDEELEIENWDTYEPELEKDTCQGQEEGPHCEDEEFNMDADYDPKKARENLVEELKRSQVKKRRNRKKKSKLAELLSTEKPKFVPTVAQKTYNQYMEEYYNMDCEDVIGGDLPTRFKYREVVPNDFGLSIEEILLADDKELTQWVPLKKILRHRPDNVEKGEVKTYAQKAADVRLKKKVLPSLFQHLPEDPDIVVPVEEIKKKKKKKNKQKKTTHDNTELFTSAEEQNGEVISETTVHTQGDDSISEQAVVEDVKIDNKEGKRKKKKKNSVSIDFEVENIQNVEPTQINAHEEVVIPKAEDEQTTEDNIANKVEKVKKKRKQKTDDQNADGIQIQNNDTNYLKRKTNTEIPQPSKKKKKNTEKPKNKNNKNMKFKQNAKFKRKNDDQPINPLNKLSDERLKAFGLNPKKYRNFIKYKKF